MARTALGRVLAREGQLAESWSELERARADLAPDARVRQALVAALELLAGAQRANGDEAAALRSLGAAREVSASGGGAPPAPR
jgi:hypothetical protein